MRAPTEEISLLVQRNMKDKRQEVVFLCLCELYSTLGCGSSLSIYLSVALKQSATSPLVLSKRYSSTSVHTLTHSLVHILAVIGVPALIRYE